MDVVCKLYVSGWWAAWVRSLPVVQKESEAVPAGAGGLCGGTASLLGVLTSCGRLVLRRYDYVMVSAERADGVDSGGRGDAGAEAADLDDEVVDLLGGVAGAGHSFHVRTFRLILGRVSGVSQASCQGF